MQSHGQDRVDPPQIEVVLPVYGNRGQLPELYERLTRVLEAMGRRHRLVFVEDAGDDGSRDWLERLATRDRRVELVALPRNLGQHRAIVEGLARCSAPATVVMDADLQDPPESIPEMTRALDPGVGAMLARRRRRYQARARHLTGRLFKGLVRRIAAPGLPRGTGTFMVMSDRARAAVVEAAGEHPYVPLLLARTGLELRTVDVPKAERSEGESAYTASRRLRMAVRALAQSLSLRVRGRRRRAGRRQSSTSDSVADPDRSRPSSSSEMPSRASSQPPTDAEGT